MWHGTGIRDNYFPVMLLVWCFRNKYFVVAYVFYDVVCRFFRLFLLVSIFFFVVVHFAIIAFLLVVFVLVVLWFFFPNSLPEVFLYIYGFVAVMTFWYVFTFFMPELFSLVPVYPARCAGTLILGFYVERFSSSLEALGPDFSFIRSNFIKSFSQIFSMVIGLSLSSSSSSRVSWWFVILQLTLIVCESSFLSCQCVRQFFVGISILSLAIHSSGFIVPSSSLHLANFVCSLVLEAPVVGSIFLESFIHASLASLYLSYFVFASSTIWKHNVSSCASISSG